MLITRFLSYGNQKFTSLYKCNANDVAGTSMENRSPSASTIMTPVVEAVPNPDENVLRKHVEFFDRNSDGIVYPWETYQGFRAIGAGVALSAISAVFINAGLSAKTRPGKGFSILFPIEVANIQFAIHGSDTGVYDSEGRFVASKFEEIFTKYAHTDPNFLTGDELQELLKANREPKDYKGWVAAWAEWKVLYLLGKDPSGVLHKDTVRRVYDGSLFLKLDKETASSI